MAALLVAFAGVVTAGLDLLAPSTRPRAAAPTPAPVAAAAPPAVTLPPTPPTVPEPQVAASTVLAAPKGTIPIYAAPGAASTGTTGTWYGYALVLPVLAQQGDWMQVRLPLRPNGSTGWVQSRDVTLSSTPYRIVVRLGSRDVIVYDAGHQILAFPAGIGTPATPTVTGNFFVAVRETSPPTPYGPFILDTSAHSEAIQSWEGAGDAIIAIHGPISAYADSEIGATGARISNGCIRLHNSDLAQLAMIPVGTPVDINA